MEHELKTDGHRPVVRVGNTVRRHLYPWSSSVHLLLEHLASVGFPAPRFLGIDAEGREILSFIKGTCGADGFVDGVERGAEVWAMVADPSGLERFARLIRDYHDAVADFTPPPDAQWATGGGVPQPGELICHNDLGPWNAVWQDGEPIAIIDWDLAAPGPPLHDVAYALEWSVPFCSDQECLTWRRFSQPPDRPARIAAFARAYGLSSPNGLIDAVIERQQAFFDREVLLAGQGIQPAADQVANGYLDAVRARQAWTIDYRHLLDTDST